MTLRSNHADCVDGEISSILALTLGISERASARRLQAVVRNGGLAQTPRRSIEPRHLHRNNGAGARGTKM
jgi:hypothetical protein